HDISIASVLQRERAANDAVPIVMMTHEAREHDMRHALAAIDRLPDVATATTMIRVEGRPASRRGGAPSRTHGTSHRSPTSRQTSGSAHPTPHSFPHPG